MKLRLGFVSNSSSSSFIIKNEKDEQRFKEVFPNKAIIPLSHIKDSFHKILHIIGNLEQYLDSTQFEGDFQFLLRTLEKEYIKEDFDAMLEEVNKQADVKITAPVDRDIAYERGIDLPVFEGDL